MYAVSGKVRCYSGIQVDFQPCLSGRDAIGAWTVGLIRLQPSLDALCFSAAQCMLAFCFWGLDALRRTKRDKEYVAALYYMPLLLPWQTRGKTPLESTLGPPGMRWPR